MYHHYPPEKRGIPGNFCQTVPLFGDDEKTVDPNSKGKAEEAFHEANKCGQCGQFECLGWEFPDPKKNM